MTKRERKDLERMGFDFGINPLAVLAIVSEGVTYESTRRTLISQIGKKQPWEQKPKKQHVRTISGVMFA